MRGLKLLLAFVLMLVAVIAILGFAGSLLEIPGW